jgi:hypothetical protein
MSRYITKIKNKKNAKTTHHLERKKYMGKFLELRQYAQVLSSLMFISLKKNVAMPFLFPCYVAKRILSLFVRLISQQPAILFSQNKPTTSNQPTVLFSQNKSASAISHQPNEQAVSY